MANKPVYIVRTGDRILNELSAREYLGQRHNKTPSPWQVCAAPFHPTHVKTQDHARVEKAPVYAVIGARAVSGSLTLIQMDRKEGDATFYHDTGVEYEVSGDSVQQIIYPISNGSFREPLPYSDLPISLKKLLRVVGNLPDNIPVSVLDIDAKKVYPAIGYSVISSANLIVFRYWVNPQPDDK